MTATYDHCPKCGTLGPHSIDYVSAVTSGCGPARASHPDGEHLHIDCDICGYLHARPCADADAAVPS